MRLSGMLLEIENYSGDFPDKVTGEAVPYSGQRMHILDGREVVKVKLPKALVGQYDHMRRGDDVDLRVIVSAQQGARGAYLQTSLVGDYETPDAELDISA